MAFESVSTWRQPLPPRLSVERDRVVADLAAAIDTASDGRLRVAVDGPTGAGKTSFGHELASALKARGRSTAGASFDDFKHPWRHAAEHGYDRTSGEGYYRNAHDHASIRGLLLEPAAAAGSGAVALCAHDPLTGQDHRGTTVQLPIDCVLIVDSVFALRPEYADLWDYRVWLEVDPEVASERGIARDQDREGRAEAERLHRDRYHVAEQLYLAEVDPQVKADSVVDNTDLAHPRLLVEGRGRALATFVDRMVAAGRVDLAQMDTIRHDRRHPPLQGP